MTIVLDACAMIAFLRDEPGAEFVERYLLDDASECFAHVINLCELYYDFLKASNPETAQAALQDLNAIGVITREDIEQEFWQQVGKYKATIRRVSLADCFAIALTNRVGGSLLTSDRHEFEAIARLGICPVTFIR